MIFRFSSYTLDASRRSLLRGGETVLLTPKVFQTLLVLVENHDRVMSKDELYRLIWPAQIVEEANLTQNVSILRRALDGSGSDKTHIVTFHGHGYRFVEPVTLEPPTDVSSLSPLPLQIPSPSVAANLPPTGGNRLWKLLAICCTGVLLLGTIAFTIIANSRQRESASPAQIEVPPASVEAITRLDGEQFEPAWSAAGDAFAFVNRNGEARQSSVYVQRNGDMRPRLLLSDNALFNSPAWSPDGRSLALIREDIDKQDIIILDIEHHTQRHLARLFPHRYGLEYRHLDWSPDGTMLVVDDKETETDPLSLYLVHLADGSKSRLTYSTMDDIGDVAPRFSPDGGTIAFIRIKYQGQNAVYRIPVTGGEAKVVLDPAILISDVGWETNNSVIFAARLDDKFRLWRMPTDNPAHKPALVSQMSSDTPVQFSLKRRTGEMAFSAYSSNLNIWAADIRQFKQWRPIIMSPGQDVAPAFSPDETRIAFRSDFGGRERLWVSGIDSSNAHAVDTGDIIPAVHAWDADSKTLLFKARYGEGLLSVNASGGPIIRATSLSMSHPARSFDGKTIFARTGHFVFQVHKDTGRADKLTSHGGAPIVESNDGNYLYFAQGRMESSIARLDLKTLQQKTILSSLIPGYNESWALTKDGIYYLSGNSGKPGISFHSFVDNKDRVVTSFPGDLPPVGDSGFAVSPDGKILLIVRAEKVASNIERTIVASVSP